MISIILVSLLLISCKTKQTPIEEFELFLVEGQTFIQSGYAEIVSSSEMLEAYLVRINPNLEAFDAFLALYDEAYFNSHKLIIIYLLGQTIKQDSIPRYYMQDQYKLSITIDRGMTWYNFGDIYEGEICLIPYQGIWQPIEVYINRI